MKKIVALLLTVVFMMGIMATSAFAATIVDVELRGEPTTLTYEVGGEFQAKEISFLVTYSDGTKKEVTHEKLTITANGTPVKQGYKFKEPSDKQVIVTYGEYEYKYNITVKAAGSKVLKSMALAAAPKTTQYRVDQGFKADEISLLCTYTDGSTETISGKKARIYANGNLIEDGYQFKQAGPKSVSVQYGDFKVAYNLHVVPNVTKEIKDVDVLTELKTLRYKVGSPFQADEISVRCNYTDGTHEDFYYNSFEIYTSEGVLLENDYKFKQAGTKYITVGFMDYEIKYTLTVS